MSNPLDSITLDRLFRATKVVPIQNRTFNVRALTDLERNMRYRTAALVRSKTARKLDDPNSDESLINFGTYEEYTDDELRDVILVFRRRDAMRDAARTVQYKFVPYPDNATEAEVDTVNHQREEALAKMGADREKFVEDYLASTKIKLSEMERNLLLGEYKRCVRESVLTSVFAEEIDMQTLFISLDGQLTLEDVRGLASQVRQRLIESITEVDNIDPLALKLPALTESSQAQPG
jgi:hypothetical protein